MVQGKMTVTDEEILQIVENKIEGPAFTTAEIAEMVDMSKEGIRSRLENLAENEKLTKKKPSSQTVIWLNSTDYRSSDLSR